MPGMNGKGPTGKGPMSGGQRGICQQTPTDKDQLPQNDTVDIVPNQGGRGLGRCQGGSGRGAGKGQGRGGNR